MPRTATFTLEEIAIKIECIFWNFMARGTFWLKKTKIVSTPYSEIPKSVLMIFVWFCSFFNWVPKLVKSHTFYFDFGTSESGVDMYLWPWSFQKIHSILKAIFSKVKEAFRGMCTVIMKIGVFSQAFQIDAQCKLTRIPWRTEQIVYYAFQCPHLMRKKDARIAFLSSKYSRFTSLAHLIIMIDFAIRFYCNKEGRQ